ncbi:MAG: hypothetical protein NTU47_06310 [Ignavibacteriales bacterium]|nr:hypothetical protein [Ignavibacteriales bacterium]
MKTVLVFLAVVLMFALAGCSEQSVEPIVASPAKPLSPAPTFQTVTISERLPVNTPEGFTGFVDVSGEINYQMVKTVVALGKEIPVPTKVVYNTLIRGNGIVAFTPPKSGLTKANIYRFKGEMAMVLEEGGESAVASFKLEDAGWAGAIYQVRFMVNKGTLVDFTNRVQLFPEM